MKFGGSGPIRSVFICLSIRLLPLLLISFSVLNLCRRFLHYIIFNFIRKRRKNSSSVSSSLKQPFSSPGFFLGPGTRLRSRGFKRQARNWRQRFSLIRNYSRLCWFATRWGARRARYNKYGYSSTAFLRRPLWSWTYPAAGPWRVLHESEVDKLRRRSSISTKSLCKSL